MIAKLAFIFQHLHKYIYKFKKQTFKTHNNQFSFLIKTFQIYCSNS
jgi:hypothetical protein